MRGFILYLTIALAGLLAAAFGFSYIGINSPFITEGLICDHLNWFAIADISSNAFHLWRADPISCSAAGVLTSNPSFSLLAYIYYLIFFLGLARFLHSESSLSRTSIFLTSICLTGSLHLLFGGNIVAAGTVVWVPWYIWSLVEIKKEQSIKTKITSLLFVLLIVFSANQVAAFALIVPVFIVGGNRFTFASALIASLFSFTSSIPSFPKYPALARVVEDDGLPGMIRPLIGPDFPIQLISRDLIVSYYGAAALIICLLSIVFLIFCSRSKKVLGLLIGLSLLIDFFAVPELSTIGPVQSLSRLIPGTSLLPLSIPFLALLSLFTTLSLTNKKNLAPIFTGLLLISSATFSYLKPDLFPSLDKQIEHLKSAAKNNNKINSPSLNVYLSESMLIEKPSFYAAPKKTKLSKNSAIVTASHRNDPRVLRRILDESPATRWSTGLGSQEGGEWLFVRLNQPTPILGIEISPGKFTTDFPRGLNVFGLSECEKNIEEPETLLKRTGTMLKSASPWQGAVAFNDQGFPYYSSQSDVRVVFDSVETVQCLLIEQTGTQRLFEWSVTELSLLQSANN